MLKKFYRALLQDVRIRRAAYQRTSNVTRLISPQDVTYEGDKDHYFQVGQSALRCILHAMLLAGREDPKTILDLPCGHGRVLRTLVAAFSDARITACDLDQDAVDFCVDAFGATPVYSKIRSDQIHIEGEFDLVWCGSSLMHVDRDYWTGFFRLFDSLLALGGVLVFSTHGRWASDKLRSRKFTYGLAESAIADVREDYDSSGFGYADYPSQRDYGISLTSPSWVCSQLATVPGLQRMNYTERGWDRHHDVFECVRVDA